MSRIKITNTIDRLNPVVCLQSTRMVLDRKVVGYRILVCFYLKEYVIGTPLEWDLPAMIGYTDVEQYLKSNYILHDTGSMLVCTTRNDGSIVPVGVKDGVIEDAPCCESIEEFNKLMKLFEQRVAPRYINLQNDLKGIAIKLCKLEEFKGLIKSISIGELCLKVYPNRINSRTSELSRRSLERSLEKLLWVGNGMYSARFTVTDLDEFLWVRVTPAMLPIQRCGDRLNWLEREEYSYHLK